MFAATKIVLAENWNNRNRLLRLANYDLKSQHSGKAFGFLWNFLNPALQIFVYWFVFAIGLNTGSPRGDYPYLIWMIVGIIPWFYISSAIMSSTMSVFSYSGVLKQMYIPLSIIPVKAVISELISHFWAMLVVFGIFLLNGNKLTFNAIWVIYFALSSVVLLSGLALLISSITVLFRDFQNIISSIVRLLFYISPVVWSQENLSESLYFVLRLNPFAYILEGYRESILYGNSPLIHWKNGIYFWAVTVIIFIIGSNLHIKFRKQFIDLI